MVTVQDIQFIRNLLIALTLLSFLHFACFISFVIYYISRKVGKK